MEIYRLHLGGFSEDAIADHLQINKSAVSRHLKRLREHNSWIGPSQRQLYTELTKEIYNAARQTMEEAYKILLDPSNTNRPEVKLGAISRVQAAIEIMANLRPDLETLMAFEQLNELYAAWEERRQSSTIDLASLAKSLGPAMAKEMARNAS